MQEREPTVRYQQVASPFCGLAVDDLEVTVQGLEVRLTGARDPITQKGFETPLVELEPQRNGQPISLDDAVHEAAQLLRASQLPLFAGLATDVNGMRATLSLADRVGGVVDSAASVGSMRNTLVLQDTGYMTTSFTEARNRMDLLVVIGGSVAQKYPRFFERVVWPEQTLFDTDLQARRVVFLGQPPSTDVPMPNGRTPEHLAVDDADLPEALSVLRALISGRSIQTSQVGGLAIEQLQALAQALLDAKYSVIAWSASDWTSPHADLAIQTLCELIKSVNQTTRCNGLPLSGKDGETTVNAVCAWQTGYPVRTSFARGYPEYDPHIYETARLIAGQEVDCLVWVSLFNVDTAPPPCALPTIVIGRSGMRFQQPPTLFIPVGVPGIDVAGICFRSDSSVALPLRALRQSGLPSAQDVLSAIERAL